jgi:integrase
MPALHHATRPPSSHVASLAVSAHANVKAVQRMLGHAKASMTLDIYARRFDEDLDGVADRLDAAIRATSDGFEG